MEQYKPMALLFIGFITLIYFSSTSISDTIRQDFFLKIICLHLHPHTNVCNTQYNETVKDQIESLTATYISISMYIEKGLPIGICLVAGSWSDVYGRKWLLLLSTFSGVVTFATYFSLSLVPSFCSQHIWILLLPSLFYAIGGTQSLFFIGIASHLGDVLIQGKTSSQIKTIGFTVIEICAMTGFPLGLLIGTAIFSWKGFPITFAVSTIIQLCIFITCQFLIPKQNSYKHDKPDILSFTGKERSDTINSSVFNRIYNACFRRRKGSLRGVMLLLIIARLVAKMGEDFYLGIIFVFVEDKFGWTIQYYNKWMATYYAFSSIGFLLVTFVLSTFISDPIQSAIGCFMGGVFCYLIGISNQNREWTMWLASSFGLLRLLPSVIARSTTSKIATSNEIGSIFSVYSSLECVIPLVVTPFGTSLFNYSLSHQTESGAVFFSAIVFFVTAASIALFTEPTWTQNLRHIQKADK